MQTNIIQEDNRNSTYSMRRTDQRLIEQLSHTFEHYHCGLLEFFSYEDNVVKVRLGGPAKLVT
jgi:hypothetical protein